MSDDKSGRPPIKTVQQIRSVIKKMLRTNKVLSTKSSFIDCPRAAVLVVSVLVGHIITTSSFRRPPGVGAELEKGAPPPFDPPDLVPRFARPNQRLA